MLVALLLLVAALLDQVIPHPAGVARAEFGSGFAGTIITIGAGLLGLFKGKIDKNVKTALDGMRLTLALAFNALADFGKDSGNTQAKSVGLLRRLWDVVIIGLIHKVDKGVRALRDWLKHTLGPILRALLKIRAVLLRIYTKWLKPIFDTIEVVRHVLQLLSFLHIDVARKLDQSLSELEARLRRLILVPLQKINDVIDQVNLVIDLGGFFQRYTLVQSQWRYVGDMWAVLLKHRPVGVSREENDELRRREYPPMDPSVLGDELDEYYRAGAGELALSIDALGPIWRASAGE